MWVFGGRDPEEEGGAIAESSSRSVGGDERKTTADRVKLTRLQNLQQRMPKKRKTHKVGLPVHIYKLVRSHPAHSGLLKTLTSGPLRVNVTFLIWKKEGVSSLC